MRAGSVADVVEIGRLAWEGLDAGARAQCARGPGDGMGVRSVWAWLCMVDRLDHTQWVGDGRAGFLVVHSEGLINHSRCHSLLAVICKWNSRTL